MRTAGRVAAPPRRVAYLTSVQLVAATSDPLELYPPKHVHHPTAGVGVERIPWMEECGRKVLEHHFVGEIRPVGRTPDVFRARPLRVSLLIGGARGAVGPKGKSREASRRAPRLDPSVSTRESLRPWGLYWRPRPPCRMVRARQALRCAWAEMDGAEARGSRARAATVAARSGCLDFVLLGLSVLGAVRVQLFHESPVLGQGRLIDLHVFCGVDEAAFRCRLAKRWLLVGH